MKARRVLHACVVAALAACASPPQTGETVPLGVLLSLSGDMAAYGVPMKDAVALAVDELNAAGGVLGKRLELVVVDDSSTGEGAAAGARSLLTRKVGLVVGNVGSSATLAAAAVLADAGVVQISPGATSTALTTFADEGYLFRTCPSDVLQGRLLAERARASGYSRAAVLSIPDAYGDSLAKAFVDAFQTTDGGTVTIQRRYEEGLDSYAPLLTEVFATSPQVVVLAGYPSDSAHIVQNYAIDYSPTRSAWLFGDALGTADFVTATGGGTFAFRHEGTVYSSRRGAPWEAFAKRFEQKAGRPAVGSDGIAQAYDAAIALALAAAKARSFEPAKVRDALGALKGGTSYGPDRLAEALAALGRGEAVSYDGVGGPVAFDAAGDPTAGVYDIWAVREGRYTIVEEAVVAP